MPSHPGHSTILLRSEIPSGMCAKLRTVAASNNRDHAPQSLLLLLARATYIMVLFFRHIPFVANHTINATPPERLQQYHQVSFSRSQKSDVFCFCGLPPVGLLHFLDIKSTYLVSCLCLNYFRTGTRKNSLTSVAAAMLRRPKPTNVWVEPTTFSPLDWVVSTIACNTFFYYCVAIYEFNVICGESPRNTSPSNFNLIPNHLFEARNF